MTASKGAAAAAEEDAQVDARGQITLPLDGTEFGLRPSRVAIEAVEKKVRALPALVAELGRGDLGLADMAAISVEFMKAYGRAYPDDPLIETYLNADVERIKDLIFEAGPMRIMARLSVLLIGALNGGYTAAGEAKPAETTAA